MKQGKSEMTHMTLENDHSEEIKPLGDAEPTFISRKDIESFSEQISEEFNLTDFSSGEDPLTQFVKNLGGRIHYQNPSDFITSEAGSIKVWGQNDFDIYLSTFSGPLRDRFTIAHELGHYFLHSRQGEVPLRATRKGSGQLEWEANWFAASLLMPSKKFAEVSANYQGDIYAIAGHFQVSSQAVEIRKKRFGA